MRPKQSTSNSERNGTPNLLKAPVVNNTLNYSSSLRPITVITLPFFIFDCLHFQKITPLNLPVHWGFGRSSDRIIEFVLSTGICWRSYSDTQIQWSQSNQEALLWDDRPVEWSPTIVQPSRKTFVGCELNQYELRKNSIQDRILDKRNDHSCWCNFTLSLSVLNRYKIL